MSQTLHNRDAFLPIQNKHGTRMTERAKPLIIVLVLFAALGVSIPNAQAHCDAEGGPVAIDALAALQTGNFQRATIWIGPQQHEELQSAFELALPVYRTGGQAQELAKRHFTETTVRLHRQAEGFPYTGLKPAQPLPPDVAAAVRALEIGDLEPLADLLTSEMRERLHRRLEEVREAQSKKHSSLAAGRAWADAYVRYVTYAHGLYETIQQGPSHGVGE